MEDFPLFGEVDFGDFGDGLLADMSPVGMDDAGGMFELDQLYQNWLADGNEGTFADFKNEFDNASNSSSDSDASGGVTGLDAGGSLTDGLKAFEGDGLLSPKPMIELSRPEAAPAHPPVSARGVGTGEVFGPVMPSQFFRTAGDLSARAPFNLGQMPETRGLVVHHTAGGGTPEGIMDVFNQRGLATQYIMDRDGQVVRSLPEGTRGRHIRPSEINDLTNSNTIGIEVIARDDADVTPQQRASMKNFINYSADRYGFAPDQVFGHGELNSHKQKTEGMSSVGDWRAYRGFDAPEAGPMIAANQPRSMQGRTLMAYAGRDDGGASPRTAQPFAAEIAAASRETGIPESILRAKIQQESSFNPEATGRAGEIGLSQVMPSTARDPGFGVDPVDPATLRDPANNIMFGARYLAGRGRAAGVTDWNDPKQAARGLTAYNGGGDPNYAQNVMRYMGGGQSGMPAVTPGPGAQQASLSNADPRPYRGQLNSIPSDGIEMIYGPYRGPSGEIGEIRGPYRGELNGIPSDELVRPIPYRRQLNDIPSNELVRPAAVRPVEGDIANANQLEADARYYDRTNPEAAAQLRARAAMARGGNGQAQSGNAGMPAPGAQPDLRMAGIGAVPVNPNGFAPARLPKLEPNATPMGPGTYAVTPAELTGDSAGLLSPNMAIPGNVSNSNSPTIPGGIAPGYIYQDAVRTLPAQAPPPPPAPPGARPNTSRTQVAGDPPPNARSKNPPASSAVETRGRSMTPQNQVPPEYFTADTGGSGMGAMRFMEGEFARREGQQPPTFGGIGAAISNGMSGVSQAINSAISGAPVQASVGTAPPGQASGRVAAVVDERTGPPRPNLNPFGFWGEAAEKNRMLLDQWEGQKALVEQLVSRGVPRERALQAINNNAAMQLALQDATRSAEQIKEQQQKARLQGFQTQVFGNPAQQLNAAPAPAEAPTPSPTGAPAPAAPQQSTTGNAAPASTSPQGQRQTAENQQAAQDEARLSNLLQRRQGVLRSAASNGLSPDDASVKAALAQVDAEISPIKTRLGRSQVNVDNRAERAFDSKTGGAIAERMQKFVEEGDQAVTDLQVIGDLRALGSKFKTGGPAALQGWLAERGIKVGENVSEIEAYEALINRLTPQQRVPGSGATSDFDARMFRGSLQRLINTPEGNEFITSSLERLADNRIRRADIAQRVQIGELQPADGIRSLRGLQEEARQISLSAREKAFGSDVKGQPGASTATPPQAAPAMPRITSQEEAMKLAPGTSFIAPDGSVRVRP
jgi:hypothetical protein